MRSAALLVLLCAACQQGMADQPRYEPFEVNPFFEDGRSMRPPVEGTVARGMLEEDDHLHRGRVGGELATEFPFDLTPEVLARGRERYTIYCSVCHGHLGHGDGPVVQRGFVQPSSYHSEKLRAAPAGHFFDVITNGFGIMASYKNRVAAEDRWAIVAYVRALQLSQAAPVDSLTPEERERLEAQR